MNTMILYRDSRKLNAKDSQVVASPVKIALKALSALLIMGFVWWCAEVLMVMNNWSESTRQAADFKERQAWFKTAHNKTLWERWTYRD